MKFADCVKETTTAVTAAVIQLLGAVAQGKFRRFIGAFAVGEGEICARQEDSQGNWEVSLFTLTDANTLTRTKILSSSNNGAAVTFAAGVKEVFSTLPAGALAEFVRLSDGISVADLPRGTPQSADLFPFERAAGGDLAITFADFLALVNGNPPASDTTGPAFPDALTASAVTQTSFTLSWQAATDASGIARYEYSYDGSTWTTAGTALSVNLTGRTTGTTYTMRVRAIDPSGNISTVRTLAVTTAAASGDTQEPSMSGSISTSNITSSGYTFSWTAGTDNVGIVRYETSIDNGASWQSTGTSLSRIVVDRPASTTDNLRVRAHDAAGNISNVLSGTVTTQPAATQTLAQKYSIAEAASFTPLPSSLSFSGGTSPNRYFAQDLKILVRAADGTYPAANSLKFFWLRTAPNAGVPTTLPAALQFTGGAWPGSVPYAANGGASGNVPNSVKGSTYFNQADYPAVFSLADTLFGGGDAGDYWLIVAHPDGSWRPIATKVAVS